MSVLTLVVAIRAKEGQAEALQAALQKLVAPTAQEKGCINYVLHRSLDDPTTFVFYENWETEEDWRNHDSAPHVAEFRKQEDRLVAEVRRYNLTPIAAG